MAKPGGRNIASAVRETLDSVVSPSVRDTILSRALLAWHRDQVPSEPSELGEFVQGPLHDSLIQSLGPELGVSVTSELERIVALAVPAPGARPARRERDSGDAVAPERRPSLKLGAVGVRRGARSTMPSREALPPGSAVAKDARWADKELRGISPTLPAARISTSQDPGALRQQRSHAPTRRAAPVQPASADYPAGTAAVLGVIGTASVDPSSQSRPLVYVASTDPELLRCFQAWLDLRAVVRAIEGPLELVAELRANVRARTVVVLDGKSPAIRPLTLAALAEEMPESTQVLLWGVPPHVHAKMRNVSSATERWLVYGADASTNELVASCAKLVGQSA